MRLLFGILTFTILILGALTINSKEYPVPQCNDRCATDVVACCHALGYERGGYCAGPNAACIKRKKTIW